MGLVDDADAPGVAVVERNQYAPGRQTRYEGSGPVDRINYPVQTRCSDGWRLFLAKNPVIRPLGAKNSADRRFGCAIRCGHRVEISDGV